MILIAQAATILFLALWITIGVRDNIIHPDVNRALTTEVLQLTRMKDEYPEIYALHANRAVEDPRWLNGLFSAIVIAEVLAAVFCWLGFAAMILAVLNVLTVEMARALALLGALTFSSVWVAFLIGGNYWCYWMCHDSSQKTHFQLAQIGILAMVFLSVA